MSKGEGHICTPGDPLKSASVPLLLRQPRPCRGRPPLEGEQVARSRRSPEARSGEAD